MTSHGHRHQTVSSLGCAVVTVSDTRTAAGDTSGARIAEMLTAAGHAVRRRDIVTDDPERIRGCLEALLEDPEIRAVVCTGGTGLAPRDVTIEVVRPLLEKEIPGFGELFRHLSFGEIGAAAMLSRATAGVVRERVLIALPGSTAAVTLAMERLVLPTLGHMVFLAAGAS